MQETDAGGPCSLFSTQPPVHQVEGPSSDDCATRTRPNSGSGIGPSVVSIGLRLDRSRSYRQTPPPHVSVQSTYPEHNLHGLVSTGVTRPTLSFRVSPPWLGWSRMGAPVEASPLTAAVVASDMESFRIRGVVPRHSRPVVPCGLHGHLPSQ